MLSKHFAKKLFWSRTIMHKEKNPGIFYSLLELLLKDGGAYMLTTFIYYIPINDTTFKQVSFQHKT